MLGVLMAQLGFLERCALALQMKTMLINEKPVNQG
jgi:hypothetical protein